MSPLGYFRLRQIIPAHFKTQSCASREEAGEIQALYPLDVPVYQIRRRIRQEFEKNRYVQNLDAINVLLFQGLAELEETLYMWKTHSHVMKYFQSAEDVEEQQRGKDFLSGFLEGKK